MGLFNKAKEEQNNTLKAKDLPGTNKKSFSMYFDGGEIWFEHLDGMYNFSEEVIEKFLEDSKTIAKISSPSLIAVNLDETEIKQEILNVITDNFITNTKFIRKVVFVGVDKQTKKAFNKSFKSRLGEYHFAITYMNDFEKAKEWLVNE